MSDDPPSFMAEVAARVVAWHNRHPLARRISRNDVQGIGSVELPYARDGQRPWHAAPPRQGMMALLFARRPRRREWPVFTEDLVPGLGREQIDRFARRYGLDDRPGPADLPQRVADFDRDRLDPPGPTPEYPPERFNRHLLTAVIDIGPQRPRLMLGDGPRPAVLGPRLWSLPRLAGVAGALLFTMVAGVAALWIKAMPTRGGELAAKPQAGTVAAASAAAPAGSPSAPRAAASAAMPIAPAASPAAPQVAAAGSASVQVPAAPAAVPATPAPTATPATAAARAPSAPAASTVASEPQPGTAAVPASAVAAGTAPSLPLLDRAPPLQMRRASQPLVPRLRPDLAASARDEAQRSGLAASMPPRPPSTGPSMAPGQAAVGSSAGGMASTPPTVAPGAAASATAAASAVPARFYALVTRPVRSKAEAEAALKRLRVETDRINHPTASQTAVLQTAEGWRVTWWPFTGPRQAENARAALARRVELEAVEF